MAKNITMLVSSRTGNTRKIANAVKDELELHGYRVHERDKGEAVRTENVIICFWCFKSRFDPLNAKLLEDMAGKRILAFGTFGGYPESVYGNKVRANVTADVDKHNTCLGVFLSQGKVGTHNIEKRRALPHDDPHYLDDAGVARIMESQRHPNENDMQRAKEFLLEHVRFFA
ncbi:hypothetical protein AAY81_03195 [Denitrobacterium detoxificans]|uniref:Flavodoxin domain-containing protein n=1 Tax=Denitrobacterium detoxificans TaxID=79604 RepID=A0A172RX65_9ACTN|nr:flavodoxin family protein [Denitrobacterium detoxificans]ANE22307.1 hypothetical protein AAY81_03195 [Denitrobacterium detoxificans]SEO61879.1 Flavodoxin domain-containing protein [Denitrobacterium detoxificans]